MAGGAWVGRTKTRIRRTQPDLSCFPPFFRRLTPTFVLSSHFPPCRCAMQLIGETPWQLPTQLNIRLGLSAACCFSSTVYHLTPLSPFPAGFVNFGDAREQREKSSFGSLIVSCGVFTRNLHRVSICPLMTNHGEMWHHFCGVFSQLVAIFPLRFSPMGTVVQCNPL